MALEEQIMAEMKDAMKSKNEAVLRSLRAIKAEIINHFSPVLVRK